MLAFVFWHWPRETATVSEYERRLAGFHEALRAEPPPGFARSEALRVKGAPWCAGDPAYEDWYLVDDFAALGVLNGAAVAGARRPAHDDVAEWTRGAAGAVYELLAGEAETPRAGATWLTKPAGLSRADYLGSLPESAALWRRQLTLGPAPEFCLVGDSVPQGSPDALHVAAERVWPG